MKPIKRWLVKAWWGHPRQRSQHSVSMVLATIIVSATSRSAAKDVARWTWHNEGRFNAGTHLTASPVQEDKP